MPSDGSSHFSDVRSQPLLKHSELPLAVKLIDAVCCLSASGTYLPDLWNGKDGRRLRAAIKRRDTPKVFDWMMDSFSYQGVSNRAAQSFINDNGNVTWKQVAAALPEAPPCPRLASYWTFHGCRYEKAALCCAEPQQLDNCAVPIPKLRNGKLNQTAFSLYLFIRDVAGGDLVRWIDHILSRGDYNANDLPASKGDALVGTMRHIYGVSDKVLTMTLSEILLAAHSDRPLWFEVGSQMIVIDTLVHNFLHRTGLLQRFGAEHGYGPACYREGRCADILRAVSRHIDARRFGSVNPSQFPRFIQHAVWQYCASEGLNVCNGNNIDDSKSCVNIYCKIISKCDRKSLL